MSNYIPYIFLTGIALLLSTMGLWFTLIVPGIDRWSKCFFRIYFFIFLLCSLSGILERGDCSKGDDTRVTVTGGRS